MGIDIKSLDKIFMGKIYLLSDYKTSNEKVKILPIFKIEYLPKKIDFSKYDGIIFTSKNSVFAIDSFNHKWKKIPSYAIAQKTANIINQTKQSGHDIFAFGTTVTRATESAFNTEANKVEAYNGPTDLFIYPAFMILYFMNIGLSLTQIGFLISSMADIEPLDWFDPVFDRYKRSAGKHYCLCEENAVGDLLHNILVESSP